MEKPGDKVIAVCHKCPRKRVMATLKLMPSNGRVNLVMICDHCSSMIGIVKENYE